MQSGVFTVLKPTTNSLVLLESDDVSPISKPTPLFSSGRRVARIRETIGRVDSPLYVASLEPGVTLKEITGKKLTIRK